VGQPQYINKKQGVGIRGTIEGKKRYQKKQQRRKEEKGDLGRSQGCNIQKKGGRTGKKLTGLKTTAKPNNTLLKRKTERTVFNERRRALQQRGGLRMGDAMKTKKGGTNGSWPFKKKNILPDTPTGGRKGGRTRWEQFFLVTTCKLRRRSGNEEDVGTQTRSFKKRWQGERGVCKSLVAQWGNGLRV